MASLQNNSLEEIKRPDRCINCSLVLLPKRHRLVKSGSSFMQTVLQSWITTTKITVSSKLCRPCFCILAALPETVELPPARLGNRFLCFPCGRPFKGLGKPIKVPKYGVKRSQLSQYVLPHLVGKLTRVCPACWKMSGNQVKINIPISDENCFKMEMTQNSPSVDKDGTFVRKREKRLSSSSSTETAGSDSAVAPPTAKRERKVRVPFEANSLSIQRRKLKRKPVKTALRGAKQLNVMVQNTEHNIYLMKRALILKVYNFLKSEYKFIKSINDPYKCDLNPLANIARRTAEATGVTMQAVRTMIEEELREKEGIQNTNRMNTVRIYTSDVNTSWINKDGLNSVKDNQIKTYKGYSRLNTTEENSFENTIAAEKPTKITEVNANTAEILKQNNVEKNTLKTNTTRTNTDENTIRTKNYFTVKQENIMFEDIGSMNTIKENTSLNTAGNTFSCYIKDLVSVTMDHCYFNTECDPMEGASQDGTGDLVLKCEVDEHEIQHDPMEGASQDGTGDLVLKCEVEEHEIQQMYEPDIESSITSVCPIASLTNKNNSTEKNTTVTKEVKSEPVDEDIEINRPKMRSPDKMPETKLGTASTQAKKPAHNSFGMEYMSFIKESTRCSRLTHRFH